MITLYLDFDGVILDTITISNNYLKNNNITKEEDIHNYFETLDWRDLMSRSSIINNAVENIWKLYESGLFEIGIITHYNSIQEIMLKDKFIKDNLPNDMDVYYVHHSNKKNSKVEAYNAVLVDDYIKNIESWEEDLGIGIKFSDTDKECQYLKINSLDEIINLYDEIKRRIEVSKIKRRTYGVKKY